MIKYCLSVLAQSYAKCAILAFLQALNLYILPFIKAILPMLKIEHLGIAVKELQNAIPLFEKLLNSTCYRTEEVESEGVKTAFFKTGDSKIELLEAFNENSPIAKFIAKKGEGIHHIAFEVVDIQTEMLRLSGLGFELLNETPKNGADNKLVCFLHPKSTNGVLIELCQEKP
jgi:methylmalonyl-CoA/ethylmalonyl-CoA epimerase